MQLDIYETGSMPVNTYVLKDEESKEAIVIDVGGDFENIKNKTESQGYTIQYILNTHGHFDHVLGEIYARQNYPTLPIYIHKDDICHLQRIKEEMSFFCSVPKDMINVFEQYPPEFIDEKTELLIGKNKVDILYTPGHSQGSLSFYISPWLFTGDTLFYRSIGRTDFYDGNFDTLITSIKSNFLILPDETIIYPGHGQSTTIKYEKQFNEFLY